jgi:hypothetical protein
MQKIRFVFIFVLFLGVFNFLFALDPSPEGILDVKVAVSESPSYISDWVKKSSEEPIFIKAIKEIKPGQTFYVAFIVSGFGVNEQGFMDLEADLILKSPDGEVGFEQKNASKAKGPVGSVNAFVMLDPALDLTLQKENDPGVYVIKAVVKDNVLNKTATGDYEIKLTDLSQM